MPGATVRVATLGFLAVTAYAAWAAAQILVLNPLAVVPGASLGDVYGEMDAVGETMPVGMTVFWLTIGVVLAAVVVAVTVRNRIDATVTGMMFLVLLVLGLPGYFFASFGPGMSLADAFATSGGDHSPWAAPLYVVSLLAAGGIIGLAARLATHRRTAVAS